MPKWIALGRRRNDFGLMANLPKDAWLIIRTNTLGIAGIDLELIPPASSGLHPAMVIIHGDWQKIYFVVEREAWNESQYFEFAQKRFKELGIKKP